MDDLEVPAGREFLTVGEGQYRLNVPGQGLTFEVDRLRRQHHELVGELTVLCSIPGARTVDGTLSVGTFNLSSPTARTQRAKLLREQSDTELDFARFLEELCQRAITAERSGAPSTPLHTVERPGPGRVVEIDGWCLPRDHPSILAGDGGTAKSYVALYGAGVMERQGIRVMLADWELDKYEHRDRFERLFGEDMPTNLFYLRCDRPMVDEADRIRREVHRLSIDYLICDSIAFAIGGRPEEAEHATAYFRAIRQIGIGSLHIAHVTKATAADEKGGDGKPFGSSFFFNSARAVWQVKPAQSTSDGQRIVVGLFNKKSNLGPIRPAVGFQLDFDAARTTITRINLADVEGLAGNLPLWQRIAHLVKAKPMTIAELADELEAKKDTVTKAVTRGRSFTQVQSHDGILRWGLVERRTA